MASNKIDPGEKPEITWRALESIAPAVAEEVRQLVDSVGPARAKEIAKLTPTFQAGESAMQELLLAAIDARVAELAGRN